jgi:hypothetical protein
MGRKPDPDEEARAQFSTAGTALLSLGGLGLFAGAVLMALGHRPQFMEPEALAITGAVIGTIGALMRLPWK